jgi:hypothetical protein
MKNKGKKGCERKKKIFHGRERKLPQEGDIVFGPKYKPLKRKKDKPLKMEYVDHV